MTGGDQKRQAPDPPPGVGWHLAGRTVVAKDMTSPALRAANQERVAELSDKLAAAFARLPDADMRIYSGSIAHELLTMRRIDEFPKFALQHDPATPLILRKIFDVTAPWNVNHGEPSAFREAEAEVQRIKKLAFSLIEAIAGLHQPAASAICENMAQNHFHNLQELLRELVIVAEHADLSGVPVSLPAARPVGRPKKTSAAAIALRAAEFYRMVTGNLPEVEQDSADRSACGPFIDLLETVFEVVNVKASVENQARGACKAIRNPGEKSPP